ncbi:hypothetical protein BJ085DRAFT_36153 [Dimargaris cristalligena]|uniref:Uncharacterized protein n=1 Tax=Dimargaris cristalligena TaxID=215637 RepID=A0A4P9ZXR3_9FUNG|nr:hypothetical protein BJ085DRAFT_36153 [Dimargaris cristalligena]|eukprot:RKP38168.1 hypothetical protein BJ085DRAFT_36153 [Dimargaris cristalligena]
MLWLTQHPWVVDHHLGFKQLNSTLQNWISAVWQADASWDYSRLCDQLFGTAATILMAQLTTTRHYEELLDFMMALSQAYLGRHSWVVTPIRLYWLYGLAILLVAVVRQMDMVEFLAVLHHDHHSESSPDYCSLGDEMWALGLLDSAVFLELTLKCDESQFDQLTQQQQWELTYNLPYLDQIHLTDDGSAQLGVAIRIRESEIDNLPELADMDAFPPYEPQWNFMVHALDPAFFTLVRSAAYAGSRRFIQEHKNVDISNLLRDRFEIPSDF